MLADLDVLLTAVFVSADDLLPDRHNNARPSVTDAEVVTLAVAQASWTLRASEREFLAVARQRLRGLIAKLPQQPRYWKRRPGLSETIEWLTAMFARDSPGYFDDVVLVDSTPVECALGRDGTPLPAGAGVPRRTTAAVTAAGVGACECTCSPPRTARRTAILASADQQARDVALRLFAIGPHGGELVLCGNGYAGRDFQTAARERYGATIVRPARQHEPGTGPVLACIRQRIESIFCTHKDRLALARHRARSLHGLPARIATKSLALAAGVGLNHYLDRPTRAFAALAA
jgi:hypothetical protein